MEFIKGQAWLQSPLGIDDLARWGIIKFKGPILPRKTADVFPLLMHKPSVRSNFSPSLLPKQRQIPCCFQSRCKVFPSVFPGLNIPEVTSDRSKSGLSVIANIMFSRTSAKTCEDGIAHLILSPVLLNYEEKIGNAGYRDSITSCDKLQESS